MSAVKRMIRLKAVLNAGAIKKSALPKNGTEKITALPTMPPPKPRIRVMRIKEPKLRRRALKIKRFNQAKPDRLPLKKVFLPLSKVFSAKKTKAVIGIKAARSQKRR